MTEWYSFRRFLLAFCTTLLLTGLSSVVPAFFLISMAPSDQQYATSSSRRVATVSNDALAATSSSLNRNIRSEETAFSMNTTIKDVGGEPTQKKKRRPPRFIFGHSPGHAGSTALHQALVKSDCPWGEPVGRFELDYANENGQETLWAWGHDCEFTRSFLLPYLKEQLSSDDQDQTFVDLGHIHNRGRVLECLADLLQDDVAFIKIRRNRHDIANSFAHKFQSPCMADAQKPHRPRVALCPRSTEVASGAGPVNLPVANDAVWDTMTPFQRFLWNADEIEHRWHTLQQREYKASPSFYEITWSDSEELTSGFESLLKELGCSPQGQLYKAKQHVKHKEGKRNCTSFIHQDLEYRRLMDYNDSTLQILFKHPQHVDSKECMETRKELQEVIKLYSDDTDLSAWVLPSAAAGDAPSQEANAGP